jgi:hypothetical protein
MKKEDESERKKIRNTNKSPTVDVTPFKKNRNEQ